MRNLWSTAPASCATRLVGVICLLMAILGNAMAEDIDTNHAVIELKKSFQDIREQFLADTNNPEIAWHFARACFDLADISINGAPKAEFARQGINAAER